MPVFKITASGEGRSGQLLGAHFRHGHATLDDPSPGVLLWFRRYGFAVSTVARHRHTGVPELSTERRIHQPMNIRRVSFDHPDAVKLNDEVQAEYHVRYGDGGDATPLDPAHFEPPNGVYFIAYDDTDRPVATGGWRSQEGNEEGHEDGDAELKRMFVIGQARGRGLARRILAALEEDARSAGRVRMVLETGTKQPEAIALYTSSGYEPCTKFGYYRHYDDSLCYAKPLHPNPSHPRTDRS